jgi:dTDP-glucose pyrophosphorylase
MKQLNIVVPMAGRGSRFAEVGYLDPKPLIDVGGKPMVQWVIENIRPTRAHRFIFICLEEHLDRYPEIPRTLRALCPNCEIVLVNDVTDGAACTVLLARNLIDDDSPLMIANSDQFVDLDVNDYLHTLDRRDAQGLIMTFWSDHPKWSYCRLGVNGSVVEVVEKRVVSNDATVGIYNFKHGADFVSAADEMIALNLRVNGEFYVAPVYNILIQRGFSILTSSTGREYAGMWGLGTPVDLDKFMKLKGLAQ